VRDAYEGEEKNISGQRGIRPLHRSWRLGKVRELKLCTQCARDTEQESLDKNINAFYYALDREKRPWSRVNSSRLYRIPKCEEEETDRGIPQCKLRHRRTPNKRGRWSNGEIKQGEHSGRYRKKWKSGGLNEGETESREKEEEERIGSKHANPSLSTR